MKKFASVLVALIVSTMMVACGDNNEQTDTNVNDVTVNDVADTVDLDVVADTTPEDTVVADIGKDGVNPDQGNDVDEEIVEDVIEDTGRPEILEYDGYYVPNVEDLYADVLPKDVDWDSLATMPDGKTFTTRYAAGLGITSITPDFEVYLGGFGNCLGNEAGCRKTDLVHDPVGVRAVAFADTTTDKIVIMVGIDNVGMIDFDVVGIHKNVQKKLYEEFNINFPGANAILAFTHAHSSIDTTGLGGPMMGAGRDEAYTTLIITQIAEACKLAVEDLQDVNLSWGVADLVENYTGDPDNLDSKMWVIKGEKPADDSIMFTLTRWAAHPTTYGSSDMTISSDYPGTFRFAMERDVGGTAIFINGSLGDVYPNRPNECGLIEEFFPEGDRTPGEEDGGQFMKTTCTGLMVAEGAQAVIEAGLTPLAETGIDVMHDVVYFHPFNDFLMFAINNIPLPFPTCEAIQDDCRIYMRYSLVKLGDLTFITAPGEIFPTFAQDLVDVAANAGLQNPMVVFGQGWLGYLMTEDHYNDATLTALDYHRGLCPGPDLYPKFIESLTKMVTPVPDI